MKGACPYLAPWYRIVATDDQVVLEYGQRILCLEGRAAATLVPALLPLLDGTRTVDEIVAILGETARPAIDAALERLDDHELLIEGPPLSRELPPPVSGTAELLASMSAGRIAAAEASASLGRSSVTVVGASALAVEIGRLLRQSGLGVDRDESMPSGVDLAICAPGPGELPMLATWNQQALDARQPWLQVLPFDGRYASVGPLYLPDETCCFECFRLRRAANLGAHEELTLLDTAPAPYPTAPAVDSVVAGFAATVAVEWLVLRDHHVPSAFYALELVPTLGVSLHHVHRVPRCPVCSGLTDVAAPLPWHKETALARP